MVGRSSLFSQLLLLVNRHQFARRVKECRAEKAAKGFSCRSQFVATMFCQLAQAKSLRLDCKLATLPWNYLRAVF